MDDLKKSWEFNLVEHSDGDAEYDVIEFQNYSGEWQVSWFAFNDHANPASWGPHSGGTISFEDFLNNQYQGIPEEVYNEVCEVINRYINEGLGD